MGRRDQTEKLSQAVCSSNSVSQELQQQQEPAAEIFVPNVNDWSRDKTTKPTS